MTKKKEFWTLDLIRFSLGTYLLIYHTWHTYPAFIEHKNLFRIFGLGNLATSVFFALSGFLLTHVYVAKEKNGKIEKPQFWIARFSTIYPLHIIGLFLSLPVLLLILFKEGGILVPADETSGMLRALTLGEMLFSLFSFLTLTHGWNPVSYYLIFNIPSWSLSALLFFYLLFPYAGPHLAKLRSPIIAIILLGTAFGAVGLVAQAFDLTDDTAEGILHHNPIVRLPLFLGGILLYAAYDRYYATSSRIKNPFALKACLIAILIASMLVGMHFYEPRKEGLYPLIRNGMYFAPALALIWLAATTETQLGASYKKWLNYLGKASLSIFMLHYPLFGLLTRIEQFLHAVLINGGINNMKAVLATARDITPQPELYPVHLILIVLLCSIVQEKFATPLQYWLRNALATRKPKPVHSMPIDESEIEIKMR